jgi:hypothetical protein
MKIKQTLFLLAALVVPASAAVTLNTQFGSAFDSLGATVPDGTLWALVVDTNNDGIFTGFNNNGSLSSTIAADTFFTAAQSISLGTVLNGNTVFALGGFNGAGPGITADTIVINYGTNGAAAALTYAIYWFPGATYSGPGAQTIGSQVGGLNTTSNDGGLFDAGMVLPNDGGLISTGAATVDGGGSIANSTFTAVNLTVIPEPSAALLGAIGALGLLRRRRN